jgi:hypothetical protein
VTWYQPNRECIYPTLGKEGNYVEDILDPLYAEPHLQFYNLIEPSMIDGSRAFS